MDRERHGDYWFVVNLIAAGPEPIWQWKVYRDPGGRVVGIDRADSEDAARQAARAWIAKQS